MTGPFEGAARLRTAATTVTMTALGAGALLALAACSGSSSPSSTASAAAASQSPVALGSGPASALQEQYEEVIQTVLRVDCCSLFALTRDGKELISYVVGEVPKLN